jgi:hypothetical protein
VAVVNCPKIASPAITSEALTTNSISVKAGRMFPVTRVRDVMV